MQATLLHMCCHSFAPDIHTYTEHTHIHTQTLQHTHTLRENRERETEGVEIRDIWLWCSVPSGSSVEVPSLPFLHLDVSLPSAPVPLYYTVHRCHIPRTSERHQPWAAQPNHGDPATGGTVTIPPHSLSSKQNFFHIQIQPAVSLCRRRFPTWAFILVIMFVERR